jgi:MoaA/NifB/PqqE/SkfB family radical SAM enzyme
MRTKIRWHLNNYCTSQCTYCPSRFWGGETPHHISEYLDITEQLISHYASLGRTIDWTFDGGEPLDMFDFPAILKLCKENNGTVVLNTNGGKMWLDWWAIEPHVDELNLTYHYWQKAPLVKFILDTFHKKGKPVNVSVPIRPDHFDEDIQRASNIEEAYSTVVSKLILYKESDPMAGMFPYTDDQLKIIRGEELVREKYHYIKTTFAERSEESVKNNPTFTGMLCNIGIEKLNITHLGWATGSDCNNRPLGNIWTYKMESLSEAEHQQKKLNRLTLPTGPHTCGMKACISSCDQKITKFSS